MSNLNVQQSLTVLLSGLIVVGFLCHWVLTF